jgi:hypothetical protein
MLLGERGGDCLWSLRILCLLKRPLLIFVVVLSLTNMKNHVLF